MKVNYLDLSVTDPGLKEELLGVVEKVFEHGRVILGPEVEELERRLRKGCLD